MKEDFSELVEYLDQRFGRVDTGILNLQEKIEKLEETKADKSDVRDLITAVDAYAHKADAYFQEMAALMSKVDRLERWVQEVAGKVGVELKS